VGGHAGARRAGARRAGAGQARRWESHMTEKKQDSVDLDFIAFLSDSAAPRLIDVTALLIRFN
jgi:hypothetical protein